MIGIDQLIAMRKAGKRPDVVWINFDQSYRHPKDLREWHNLELEYSHSRDLRPFINLDVIICSAHWTEDVGALFERLTSYARTITVLVADFGDDIGWWWDKRFGRTDFGARCFAREIQEAQADAMTAAIRGNKAEYAEAQARELNAIQARGE